MKRVRQRRQRRSDVRDLTTAVQGLTTELRTWRAALFPPPAAAVVMPMEGFGLPGGEVTAFDERAFQLGLEELLRQRTRRDPNDVVPGYEGLE